MIREAIERDLDCLAVLATQVWLHTYAKPGINQAVSEYVMKNFTPDCFRRVQNDVDKALLVYEHQSSLVGFAQLGMNSSCSEGDFGFEIERLYISPFFQGQGIGRQIINTIKSQFGEKFWLYTWVENEANDFYLKQGFKHIGQYQFHFEADLVDNNIWAMDS